jgi:hypothetical protein
LPLYQAVNWGVTHDFGPNSEFFRNASLGWLAHVILRRDSDYAWLWRLIGIGTCGCGWDPKAKEG